MFQRIQTVYIILVILNSILIAIQQILVFNLFSLNTILTIYFLLAIYLAFAILISFKKRKKQIVLNRLVIFIFLLALLMSIYYSYTHSEESIFSLRGIEKIICIANIVLLVLANRSIRRDEKKILDTDRLR